MSPLIYQNNLNIKQYKKAGFLPLLFIYVNLIFELNYGNEQHLYYVNTFVSYDVDVPLLIIRGVSDDHEYELLSVHLDYYFLQLFTQFAPQENLDRFRVR